MNRENISAWLKAHEADMLADICRLIRIDSTKQEAEEGKPFGAGPAEAVGLATAMMREYGLKAENMENYVCTGDLCEKETGLDILAHLDVVPVSPEEWTVTAPFEPLVKDGKLYGRGSADDKGPAVAALYAMRALKELGIPLSKNVRLILGSDEECGGADIEYYYAKHKPAQYTLSPDAEFPVINVERGRYASGFTANVEDDNIISIACGSKDNVIPGSFEIEFKGLNEEQKQSIDLKAKQLGVSVSYTQEESSVRMTVTGVSGHAAEPWDAVNALTASLELIAELRIDSKLGKMLMKLSDVFPFGDHFGKALGIAASDEVSGELTISLNRMDYKDGSFSCVFDSRLPEVVDGEELKAYLTKTSEGLGAVLMDRPLTRPHIVRSDSEFVQTLLRCYEEVSGRKGYTMAIGGGTYVHEIENGVAFGPAETEIKTNLHGFDENIPVDCLMNTALIYACVIIELCG